MAQGDVTAELENTPWENYQRDLQREDFSYDPEQEKAVKHLQRLHEDLVEQQRTARSLWSKLQTLLKRNQPPVKGLYFWGGVGRGKTYLVDTFFDSLPFEHKMRVHFHRFMHRVHQRLTELKGTSNPLKIIAEELADEAAVLCFDEFFVSDITDAMLLGGLLKEMFANGVTLVATSNIPPERLYWNGLQRDRFLPAIELLQQHTEVVNVDGGVDYRLRTLEQAEIYHSPLDQAANDNMVFSFERLVTEEQPQAKTVEINGRQLAIVRLGEGVIWFTFDALCNTPRSQSDYMEIARCYQTVLLSDTPQMSDGHNDAMRRFIALVDEFYERKVKLILSAEVPLPQLYVGQRLAFEFERTKSRLQEMQSHDYLASQHLP